MDTFPLAPARRKGRRATSAQRDHTDPRRPPVREIPGRGRVVVTGPGAVEFLRALETDGDA